MRVLVVGGGAREHALAWKLSRSPEVEQVLSAPGNAGTARVGKNVSVSAADIPRLVGLAEARGVGLVVVGPEAPLAAGLVDALRDEGIPAFGPDRAAAQLEASKEVAKRFMAEHAIPTADYAAFDDADQAEAWIRGRGEAMVVKADGLAAGKGVVVAETVDETVAAARSCLVDGAHGDAGRRVVVEEKLVGPEVSYHVVSDGSRYVALAAAQDHKRLLEGDRGPNTGGMGAYSPPPMVTPEVEAAIRAQVVQPTISGMADRGTPFRGTLFIGLMIVDGQPKVLEYNVRFGDPETQCLMTRWKGDALPLFLGAAHGDLRGVETAWDAPASATVVLASEGYPGKYPKGRVITGIDDAEALDGVTVFQAGTELVDGEVRTSGGRVLSVTAIGESVAQATERAYAGVEKIAFEGAQHRRDIGWQAKT